MPTPPSSRSGERATGIDMLRGLLLLLMTISHVPVVWSGIWGQPLGFISAAEGFVFLSAFLAARVFIKRYRQQGAGAATGWAMRRAAHIYLCHLALLALAFTVIAWLASHFHRPAAMNLLDFYFRDPNLAAISALALVYQPPLLDILPMYVLFLLATAPVMLLALRHGWRLPLLLSLGLWGLAQFGLRPRLFDLASRGFDASLPFNALGAFDLFAWQGLWVLGLWFGAVGMDALRAEVQRGDGVLVAGLTVSLSLFIWRHVSGPMGFTDMARHFFWIDKWTLSPVRVLNFAALVCLLVGLGRYWPRLGRMRMLESLGRASLWAFVAHLGSVLLLLLLIDQSDQPLQGPLGWAAVLFAYCTLFATAALYRVHKRRPALPQARDSL